MNISHINSEPVIFTIAIMAVALVAMLVIWRMWRKGLELDYDLPYREIDELQRLIEQRNAECGIKADYDCNG